MITALHHIGVAVRNLDRMATFLTETFGFAPSAGPAAPHHADIAGEKAGRAVTLRAPNCRIELIEHVGAGSVAPPDRPVNEPGITHICVQSRDIDALYERLLGAGARPNAPPIALGTGTIYLYARDVEANVIEVEGLPYAPADQPPWVAHVAIATPNIERLATFYHTLLGGERRGGTKIGPNPRYDELTGLRDVEVIPTWVVGGNVTVELWQYLNPPTVARSHVRAFAEPGYSHVCFAVRDAAAAVAAFARAGGREPRGPTATDGVSAASIRDPDGNLLELVEIRDGEDQSTRYLEAPDVVRRIEALRTTFGGGES